MYNRRKHACTRLALTCCGGCQLHCALRLLRAMCSRVLSHGPRQREAVRKAFEDLLADLTLWLAAATPAVPDVLVPGRSDQREPFCQV